MALEIAPHIVIDPNTGKTFRQSHMKDRHGMHKFRRAKRLVRGLWWTYRNSFLDYPGEYQKWSEKPGGPGVIESSDKSTGD